MNRLSGITNTHLHALFLLQPRTHISSRISFPSYSRHFSFFLHLFVTFNHDLYLSSVSAGFQDAQVEVNIENLFICFTLSIHPLLRLINSSDKMIKSEELIR